MLTKDDVKLKVEQEFEALVAKVSAALAGYDHRLLDHIEQTKKNVLAHTGLAEAPAPAESEPTK